MVENLLLLHLIKRKLVNTQYVEQVPFIFQVMMHVENAIITVKFVIPRVIIAILAKIDFILMEKPVKIVLKDVKFVRMVKHALNAESLNISYQVVTFAYVNQNFMKIIITVIHAFLDV